MLASLPRAGPVVASVAAVQRSFCTAAQQAEWSPASRRSGILGIKCGMLSEWDSWGVRHPLTVLKVDCCEVVQVKTDANDGYTALQVGIGSKNVKRVKKPERGHFTASRVEPKQHLGEFRVTEDAILPPGTEIFAAHFVPGQKVDVCGSSIGKGFAGAMKRWNFRGGRATHGNSKAHRSAGSTGGCQEPGKVWKGKKMAGNLGDERVTIKNLEVYKIDIPRNLLFIRGHVPGSKGGVVRVSDAHTQPFPRSPPFPTIPLEALENLPKEYSRDPSPENPWATNIE